MVGSRNARKGSMNISERKKDGWKPMITGKKGEIKQIWKRKEIDGRKEEGRKERKNVGSREISMEGRQERTRK